MNKVILFGNIGNDPLIKTFEGGNKNAKFSLATSSKYKDKDGNDMNNTQWHNIVFWGKLAELCEKYIKKGSPLIVEGEIRYRSYEDKNGETKYITEIIGNALHFVGRKEKSENEATEPEPETKSIKEQIIEKSAANNEVPKQDDLPF